MQRKPKLLGLLICLPLGLAGQANNQEFRATWTITWNLIDPNADAATNQARARTIMDQHAAANMNAVLWQARQNGTAYYNSSYEPWGTYAGGAYPGYDPLAYAVEQAHARGLELHAWMNTFESRNPVPGSPSYEHPDWVCRDGSGNPMPAHHALSPGLDTVRAYLVNVAMEIVRNYDIDGLHLDYIRWNEYTVSNVNTVPPLTKGGGREEYPPDGVISPADLQALNEASNHERYLYDVDHLYSDTPPATFSTWEDYWRWSVTEFVSTLHDSIQAVKPWVRLSVAALGRYNWGGTGAWNGYHRVFQDAALWFNDGAIDQLTPMLYHWTDGPGILGAIAGNPGANWGENIQQGILAGRLYTGGPASYILDRDNTWGRHGEIVASIRSVDWVDGFQFFSYGSWDNRRYWDTAGLTIFPSKTKIRATKLIVATPPAAPSLELVRVDSLTYQLTATPPPNATGDQWVALYRSVDAQLDTSADRILRLHFGSDAITYTDQFTGSQDFNGIYTYGATSLDRYWNESAPSNVVSTDPIPSFPPAVALSTPGQGDTLQVDSRISLSFTKTMATGSFVNAVHLTPAVGINALSWSPDNRTVQISLAQYLLYATDYELRLDATVTDINGAALDGNGDGVAGDPYVLHFASESEDVAAPAIWSAYPLQDGSTDNFKRDEVVSLVYNEVVDPATVTDTTVLLTTLGQAVEARTVLTQSRSRSVLSLQSLAPLAVNEPHTIRVRAGLADLVGNVVGDDILLGFWTATQDYTEIRTVDNFASTGYWEDPDYSGSTTGTIPFLTTFAPSTEAFLPAATAPIQKRSAALHYEWDVNSTEFLLREYLSGSPRDIVLDSSYTLQAYVFGDGSGNQFRFCVDDGRPGGASFHEVSRWLTLDWYGWRLVEWDLGDSGAFGSWLGNGSWDNPNSLYMDSFQLTHPPGGALTGTVYFDELRLVKTAYSLEVVEAAPPLPQRLALSQNYPNPFNAVTHIPFALPTGGPVELSIYDLKGRLVERVLKATLPAGHHVARWRGETQSGGQAASGVYIVHLRAGNASSTGRLVLLK